MVGCFFVYGTLLAAERMEAVLAGAASWRIVGPAAVGGALYDLGDYPGMKLGDGADALVPGLLLEIDPEGAALSLLDAYEGVGDGLFTRRRIALQRGAAEHRTAWLYEYRGSVHGLRRLRAWSVAQTSDAGD